VICKQCGSLLKGKKLRKCPACNWSPDKKKKYKNIFKYTDENLRLTPKGKHTYCFKSAREYDQAVKLELLKRAGEIIDWAYEPESWEIEGGTYKPDFWVKTETGETYIECKGVMTPAAKRKLKQVYIRYPEVNLVITFKDRPPVKLQDYFKKKKK